MKATVDAYTGKVTLYSWNQVTQPDPVLQTWEDAFPGLVQPESSIPSALLPHLRYPQDLFDVQRSLLTQYHVTDPGDFYNGSDFWTAFSEKTYCFAIVRVRQGSLQMTAYRDDGSMLDSMMITK